MNEVSVESGGETIFLRGSMETTRTDDHRVALAGYLEMMLDALIKWRLPFPVKGAARKKMQGPPLSTSE